MLDTLDLQRLAAIVEAEPGAPEFSILAEAYRRMGQPEDARRVAVAGLAEVPDSVAGRLALALCLLDLGESEATRYELVRAIEALPEHGLLETRREDGADTQAGGLSFASPPPLAASVPSSPDAADGAIGDDELEAAFAQAEALPDEMVDVNRVAVDAMAGGGLGEPEGFDPLDHPDFATATMAGLLESQGDRTAADAIRQSITPADPEPDSGGDGGPAARIIATLETWLGNLRGVSP